MRVQLKDTSAAVIERTIPSLPIDMHAGRLDGELRLHCHTPHTWAFPDFGGHIRGRSLNFHFYDAPDDFADTDMDLVFEGHRMYIHGAAGHYGAVPLTCTVGMRNRLL